MRGGVCPASLSLRTGTIFLLTTAIGDARQEGSGIIHSYGIRTSTTGRAAALNEETAP